MKNKALAWAAAGVTLAGLARRFTLPKDVRYALVGDLVWQREGLTRRVERPWPMRLL